VQTASAIRAEIVCVIDIAQQCGFELGIVHAPTIAPSAFELLLYNSYMFGVTDYCIRAGHGAAGAVVMMSPAWETSHLWRKELTTMIDEQRGNHQGGISTGNSQTPIVMPSRAT
jgi:hypothetical protein